MSIRAIKITIITIAIILAALNVAWLIVVFFLDMAAPIAVELVFTEADVQDKNIKLLQAQGISDELNAIESDILRTDLDSVDEDVKILERQLLH
jgi:hypothetical protein